MDFPRRPGQKIGHWQAEIGKRLEMSESAVRVGVHRLRARYRRMLREEIAATIGSQTEVDDEIANLISTFARD